MNQGVCEQVGTPAHALRRTRRRLLCATSCGQNVLLDGLNRRQCSATATRGGRIDGCHRTCAFVGGWPRLAAGPGGRRQASRSVQRTSKLLPPGALRQGSALAAHGSRHACSWATGIRLALSRPNGSPAPAAAPPQTDWRAGTGGRRLPPAEAVTRMASLSVAAASRRRRGADWSHGYGRAAPSCWPARPRDHVSPSASSSPEFRCSGSGPAAPVVAPGLAVGVLGAAAAQLARQHTNVHLVKQAITLPSAVAIAWLLARTDLPGRNGLEFGFWVAFSCRP